MSTNNEDVDYKLKINKRIIDIEKAMSEIRLTDIKSQWHIVTVVAALIGATTVLIGAVITLTKLFL